MQFAFIQALSQWILEDGAPAVKEFEEFKTDVQLEIENLVATCNDYSTQNQEFNLILTEVKGENAEMAKAYEEVTKEYEKVLQELQDKEQDQEADALDHSDFNELQKQLDAATKEKEQVKEKHLRFQTYLKQSQTQNDDLLNKGYKLEDDLATSKTEVSKLKTTINQLRVQNERELRLLNQEHHKFKAQMESEQLQLAMIAEDCQRQLRDALNSNSKQRSNTMDLGSDFVCA